MLKETVDENMLHQFYPEQTLRQLAEEISRRDPINIICQQWKLPLEIGFDLTKLALYDVVFLLDDSGSIHFSGLKDELKFLLKSVAFASSLFDQDGFAVRFMNSDLKGDGIRTEAQAEDLVNRVDFSGVTPLAGSFDRKILAQFAPTDVAVPSTLRKPVMVIIITDGMVKATKLLQSGWVLILFAYIAYR